MPEWWTNRSLHDSSGVMKPKPFSSLNHFTVPVAMWTSTGVVVLRSRRTLREADSAGAGTTFAGLSPAERRARYQADRVIARLVRDQWSACRSRVTLDRRATLVSVIDEGSGVVASDDAPRRALFGIGHRPRRCSEGRARTT